FAADLHEDVIFTAKPYTPRHIAAGIVNSMISGAAWALAWNTVSEVRRAIRARFPQADTHLESTYQAGIVRDLFRDPFRPTTANHAWQAPSVTQCAQAIYDEGTFDRLPALADVLEEVGCDNADILTHCRGLEPHVRGCWVVDLILGKA